MFVNFDEIWIPGEQDMSPAESAQYLRTLHNLKRNDPIKYQYLKHRDIAAAEMTHLRWFGSLQHAEETRPHYRAQKKDENGRYLEITDALTEAWVKDNFGPVFGEVVKTMSKVWVPIPCGDGNEKEDSIPLPPEIVVKKVKLRFGQAGRDLCVPSCVCSALFF